jgi:ribonuclease-3
MPDLTVILRTHSDIEANIVRGLLEAHGIQSMLSSDVPHSVFPLSIDGLGEVRVSVRHDDADEAQRIIADYRAEVARGHVVPFAADLQVLEERIAYRFRDRGLLEHALTHRSRAHEDETGGVTDNESLEFLGDAVLGFIVADRLFHAFPDSTEGDKSKMKAALVSAASLARLSMHLDLGRYLLLGRGEEKTGGRRKQTLLADGYEALIAALYLDGGLEAVRRFVHREFADLIEEVSQQRVVGLDYKSALQEFLQARDRPLPEYRVVDQEGPAHDRIFNVDVVLQGQVVGNASGRSKKEAEQAAAQGALEKLRANLSQ